MRRPTSSRSTCAAVLAALLLVPGASAQVPGEIAVQGRLETPGGAPVTDPQVVAVRLFDASTGGTEITSESDPVAPDDAGVFVTTLGDGAPLDAADLAGPRWLEFEVEGGAGPLGPRTKLAAAPYALRAARAEQGPSAQVVHVPHSGNDAASGAALIAAATAITDASSSKPYVLSLGPGIYDLAGGSVELPPYTALVGVGRAATWVNSTAYASATTGVVVLATAASLRDLSVWSSSAAAHATALYLPEGALTQAELVRVAATATNGSASSVGLRSDGSNDEIRAHACKFSATNSATSGVSRAVWLGELDQFEAHASRFLASATGNGALLAALYSEANAGIVVKGSHLEGTHLGTGGTMAGIKAEGAGGLLEVRASTIKLESSFGSVGSAYGIDALGTGWILTVGDSAVSVFPAGASAGSASGIVAADGAVISVYGSTVDVGDTGGGTASGVEAYGVGPFSNLRVHGSRIWAFDRGAFVEAGNTMKLLSSQVSGGTTDVTGAASCFAVTDASLGSAGLTVCP